MTVGPVDGTIIAATKVRTRDHTLISQYSMKKLKNKIDLILLRF
jgi:hypothetical protein